jgi:two-component system response regulator
VIPGSTILLVEDHDGDATLFAIAVRKSCPQATLQIVTNTVKAMEYFEGRGKYADRKQFPAPAMAFVDLNLPGDPGQQLIHWIRKQEEFQKIPIAVLHSGRDARALKDLHRWGADSFLLKSHDLMELSNDLRDLTTFWLQRGLLSSEPGDSSPRSDNHRDGGFPAEGTAGGLKRILLVEDLEDDVLLFKVASRKTGIPHSLEIKSDGAAAIEYLSSVRYKANTKDSKMPDLILLDIKMPKVDGHEVLAWIRGQRQFSTLPVVILTSSADPRDESKAMGSGANSFIIKTGDMMQFRNNVQATMQFWFNVHHQPQNS